MNASPTVNVKGLTCAETAKLVRAELKKHFPGVKFSVRSKTYGGGSSISISYVGGPASRTVEDAVNWLQGCDFDRMIDMKTYRAAVLVANEDGSYEEIRSGANFIHAQRGIDPGEYRTVGGEMTIVERAAAALEEEAQGHFEREARYAEERDPGGKATANRRACELQRLAAKLREAKG
jgi:Large polyvalent protein associated domain 29